jgi:DNA-binding transcriptional ArsR family regulator
MKQGLTTICHKFFTNLSNPTRLAALEKLAEKPHSVNDLAQALGQEQSMISHNLKPLLQCNFIYLQRKGKQRIYSLNHETVDALFKVIENHAEKFCPTGGKCLLQEGET